MLEVFIFVQIFDCAINLGLFFEKRGVGGLSFLQLVCRVYVHEIFEEVGSISGFFDSVAFLRLLFGDYLAFIRHYHVLFLLLVLFRIFAANMISFLFGFEAGLTAVAYTDGFLYILSILSSYTII